MRIKPSRMRVGCVQLGVRVAMRTLAPLRVMIRKRSVWSLSVFCMVFSIWFGACYGRDFDL